jgi:hypothetical protein
MTRTRPRPRRADTAAVIAGCAALSAIVVLGAPRPAVSAVASPWPSRPPASLPLADPASANSAAGLTAAYSKQIPLLAYFYIWYAPTSWNRLKIDYPLVGRYSSDDAAVMREQVKLAKQVGITGFLVSWKDTPILNRRLAALSAVAAADNFKLGIVVEGRDFAGDPISMTEIRRSFSYVVSHYGSDPIYNIVGKPLVVWSGTWVYTTQQLASISTAFGTKLTILASEKEPASYQLVAHLFSGDAYYWSSADPLHTPGYAAKLDQFSAVVHKAGGLWVAPAAPGFDARLLGGIRDVPRRDGQTLRLAMNAAMASSPDAIGLISWNEYSENSQIEPSQTYGPTAIQVIASIEHAKAPVVQNFNSSNPSGFHPGPSQFLIVGTFVLFLVGSVVLVMKRKVKQ